MLSDEPVTLKAPLFYRASRGEAGGTHFYRLILSDEPVTWG